MIAYNHKSLDAFKINDEARMAMHGNQISKEEHIAIKNAYPESLYSPNLFIRIGLFLLTTVIVSMSFGLYFLVFGSLLGEETGIGIFTGIFALLIYVALELMVVKNRHFRSGVDDALLWLSMGFMVGAVNIVSLHLSYLDQAILIFFLAAYSTIRFANRFMAGLVVIAFLAIIFYSVIRLGDTAKVIMPFLLMAVSVLVYLLVRKCIKNKMLRHYASCLLVIEVLSLISAYAAVNYFIVRELSNEMFGLQLREGATIPGGWFFWASTILIPIIYLLRGMQKKDNVLLRTGLILIAAMIFTIRYYYHLAPIEVAMTIGGITMIILSYTVAKYLTTPRHGITNEISDDPMLLGAPQLEALIVAETFHQTPGEGKHFDFGGGSGGGGGATGQY
jgi:hypothetical protein